jgi:hypothetical protein
LPQAFDAYISVEGYSLKDSGGHKKTKLAKYIKIPEALGKTLYDRFQ